MKKVQDASFKALFLAFWSSVIVGSGMGPLGFYMERFWKYWEKFVEVNRWICVVYEHWDKDARLATFRGNYGHMIDSKVIDWLIDILSIID